MAVSSSSGSRNPANQQPYDMILFGDSLSDEVECRSRTEQTGCSHCRAVSPHGDRAVSDRTAVIDCPNILFSRPVSGSIVDMTS